MIKIKKNCQLDAKGAFLANYNFSDLIFFDIESTGFSIEYSNVYLIGAVYYQKNQWVLEQFFAENLSEEKKIIEEFFTLASAYNYIIHFNGDTFDIPYLEKKASLHHLEAPFKKMTSIDILKLIRPYQKILGLENCKLKTIEHFLDINRKDIYSGKELIELYQQFCKKHDPKVKENILLHNEEDLLYLIPLLKIFDLIQFIKDLKVNILDNIQAFDITVDNDLLFSFALLKAAPLSLQLKNENWACSITKDSLHLDFKVKLVEDTMYHFFPNYKDYYYLIDEDEAIHKSLGAFLPKDKRKQAKVSNCYTKRKGLFLQTFQPDIRLPVFKKSYDSKEMYILLDDNKIDHQKLNLKDLALAFIDSQIPRSL